MTAGKARLFVGIACVGSLVLTSTAMLATDFAGLLFPATPLPPMSELMALIVFFAAVAALLLPFDIVGGLIIPTLFESQIPESGTWFRRWARSVLVQTVFYTLTFFAYLQVGREIGGAWLIAFFSVLQVGLLAGQELLWRLMNARLLTSVDSGTVSFVSSSDPRFVGGITGLPGLETILLPGRWRTRLKPGQLQTLLRRRRAAMASGARLRGIITAMLWNVSCFSLAIVLSGPTIAAVADMVNLFLWFLLLSFAGLLLLPALSRRSVYALDQKVAQQLGVNELRETISAIDNLTEQEATRTAAAESVFQPIPCPERRALALSRTTLRPTGAWNVARLALYLSWAFGGPLARAVHCNVGRPELWAMLPAD